MWLKLIHSAGITNAITWTLEGPGFPTPTVGATGTTTHARAFAQPGLYTLTGTYAGPPSLSGSSQPLELDGQGLWFDLLLFPDFAS